LLNPKDEEDLNR